MKNMGKKKSVEFIILFSVYIALLCIVVHPKRFSIMWGGGGVSPQPPPVYSIHLDEKYFFCNE